MVETGKPPKEYPSKPSPITSWEKTIHEIKRDKYWSPFNLEKLTQLGVLKIGLNIKCKFCEHPTWYELQNLSYDSLTCEECLELFPFPQVNAYNLAKWFYRSKGVFTLPDYAKGAYTTALALRFFCSTLDNNIFESKSTWSTSLEVKGANGSIELADFCLWYQRCEPNTLQKPQLVWGEAKSFSEESFQPKDIENMKKLAREFPGSFLVFATMKDSLSKKEKKRLTTLAEWGNRYAPEIGRRRAYVIILTGTELFTEHYLTETWKEKKGQHAELVNHPSVRPDNLEVLAGLTQKLYLSVPTSL